MRKVLIGILVLGIVLAAGLEGGTISYFRDIEQSRGNVFQAGTWKTQADNLKIDTSQTFVSARKLHNVQTSNIGDGDITIIEVKISWKPDNGEKVTKVWAIGERPGKIWEDKESSGAILDIKDCYLKVSETSKFEFLFDSKMKEKEFTIEFLMEDGSSKGVTFKPIYKGDENE